MKQSKSKDAAPAESETDHREQGSALIVVMIVVVMMLLLAVVVAGLSSSRSQTAMESRVRIEALAAAEAALMLRLEEFNLAASSDAGYTDPGTYTLTNGTATVTVVDLGNNNFDDDGDGSDDNGNENGVFRFTSTATVRGQRRAIEVHLMAETHPLFFKAIYAGNKYDLSYTLNLGVGSGNPNGGNGNRGNMGGSNFNNNSRSKNSDYIQGDIHINGGLHSTGNTQITGDVDVTGGYTGNNPDGTMTNGAARIEPPDLSLMEYRAKSREANSWFIESCANHFAVGSNEWTYSASGKHSKDHGPSPTESGYPEEETNPSYTSEQQAHYTKGGSYAGGDLNNWPAGTLRDSATANPPSFLSYGPFSDSTNNPDGKNNEYDSSGSNDRNSNQYFWQDNFDEFTNGNFHFGYGADGRDSDGEDKIDFSSVAGPDGIYGNDDDITFFFIRGNVWLDTRGQLDFLFPDDIPAGQTLPPITVVIEGNLYIGDGMTYANDTDALMFIVKESDFHDENFMDDDRNGLFDFDDANNNGVQDGDEAGEEPYKTADGIWVPAGTAPDDADGGNGVLPYRGPKEGQGNVYFGDLKAAYGGTTAGFIFAENNVYMVADNPDIYGVEGFLNAGGTINMGQRQGGNNYVEYRVRYDDRIETGEIEFNGMPKNQNDNGEDKLSKVTWREVVPQ